MVHSADLIIVYVARLNILRLTIVSIDLWHSDSSAVLAKVLTYAPKGQKQPLFQGCFTQMDQRTEGHRETWFMPHRSRSYF